MSNHQILNQTFAFSIYFKVPFKLHTCIQTDRQPGRQTDRQTHTLKVWFWESLTGAVNSKNVTELKYLHPPIFESKLQFCLLL